jgi:hypothetical protein
MEPAISSLIAAAEQGDSSAATALFAQLYSELHRLSGANSRGTASASASA